MTARAPKSFFIGDWEVFPEINRLSRQGDERKVAPKFMQVLLLLVEARGEVVTREALLDSVWSGTVVGEAVLTRAVSELRKILDDGLAAPLQAIETIPTVGYRLMLEPRPAAADLASDPAAEESKVKKSIFPWMAVMGIGLVAVFWNAFSGRPQPANEPFRLQPVTSLVGAEYDPAISRDGSQIVFARTDELESDSDIYLKTGPGASPLAIVEGPGFESSPTWSPDGRFIAFVRCDLNTGEAGIYTKTPDLQSREQLVHALAVPHCMAVPKIDWSPKGDEIAFSAPTMSLNTEAIWTVNLTNQEVIQRSFPTTGEVDHLPRFDNSGDRIAFTRGPSGISSGINLWLGMNGQGSAVQLTNGELEIVGYDWSAGNEDLIVASKGAIWKVGARKEGEISWLAAPGMDVIQPVVNKVDGSIIFVQSLQDVNIWIIEAQQPENQARVLLGTTRMDNDPRISPDGKQIAFISDRGGACNVFVSELDGSQEVSLASFDINCYDVRTPRWSPDGLFVAFEAGVGGNWDIYSASTAGGEVRRVTFADSREWSPGWSADGKVLYFSSDRSGSKRIWAVPIGGGDPFLVTQTDGTIAQETTDGKSLLYVQPGMPGLWSLVLGDERAEPVLLIDDLSQDDFRSWRLDGNSVSYIRRGEKPELVKFDLATHTKTVSIQLPTSLYNCSVADVSPDGTLAVFAQVDREEYDLVKLAGLVP
jgi:Tol biopolymer transport system component/DNA-binding winged helix-turn-helix (wHTH) protein